MGAARDGEPRPELFARHLELTLRLGNEEASAIRRGLAACAVVLGDLERAGILLGAVDMLRTRTGSVDQRSLPHVGPHRGACARLRARGDVRRRPASAGAMSRRAALATRFGRSSRDRVTA
jgi:hypothetical protein